MCVCVCVCLCGKGIWDAGSRCLVSLAKSFLIRVALSNIMEIIFLFLKNPCFNYHKGSAG